MIIISKNQISLFNEQRQDDFLRRMIVFIRNIIPHRMKDKTDEILKSEIQTLYSFGVKFGITSEEHMERFVYLNIRYDKMKSKPYPPDVLEILTFPSRSEEDKIEYLEKHLLIENKK